MIELIKNIVQYNQGISCDLDRIPIVSELINYCSMNHCGKYNKRWSCPPANNSDFASLSARYNKAYVFNKIYYMDDAFDIEGMNASLNQNNDMVYAISKQLKNHNMDFYILKAGACNLCNKCAYPDNPCRLPDMMYPPIESYGIDVTNLARELDLNYYNGINTITYFTIVLYN